MKKILITLILVYLAVCFILAINLTWYVFKPETLTFSQAQATNWAATTSQKIVDLPDAPYKCKTLVAVIGENVNFCKLTSNRPILNNTPMVMGDFNRNTNQIRITKETTNDAIVHELTHYAISCTRATNDEELCVRSAQKMMLELNLIK